MSQLLASPILLMSTDRALGLLLAKYDLVWQNLHAFPRQASEHVKQVTYLRWFDWGRWLDRPSYLFFDFSANLKATWTYLRICLGSHNLVELGHWHERRLRHLRLC